jgi:release factor H-coupled RctB family protein
MTEGGLLHRKGAARARAGYPTPLAGSRESDSHLLMADEAVATALHSLAHGAGRKYDRSSMHGRVQGRKSDLVAMAQPGPNQRVICDDKDLMIEEAGTAYKDVDRVLADLEREGLAHSIARLSPIITFKKAADHDHSDARGRKNNHGR